MTDDTQTRTLTTCPRCQNQARLLPGEVTSWLELHGPGRCEEPDVLIPGDPRPEFSL